MTALLGRERDVRDVGGLLDRARLVTLTGPGGVGKTRLALELAAQRLPVQPDGAWVIELAGVRDPAQVPQAVAATLGIRLPAARTGPVTGPAPLEALVGALSTRCALLVLDNCEHLVTAVARLADELLARCPRLRILATSREALGIRGERLWPVEPFALPPEGAGADQALRYVSVRLFAERAAALAPEFTVDDTTAASVVRICRALDGMPLSLELAAARIRALGPRQIADRLDDRFRLLTGGSRAGLNRHQTLRAVVDWSWDLLSEAERTLLRELSVFVGSVSVDGVERVCTGHPDLGGTLDILSALVEKSLVKAGEVDAAGRPRYRMLDTVRAYGAERLDESGETRPLRQAHADYFLCLAERLEPRLRGASQIDTIRRITAERDNLRAAVRWSAEDGRSAMTLRFFVSLGWYWWLSGQHRECAELAAQALDTAAATALREGTAPGDGAPPAELWATAYALRAVNALGHGDKGQLLEWLSLAARLRGDGSAHPVLRLIDPLVASLGPGGPDRVRESAAGLFTDHDPWVRAFARYLHADAGTGTGRTEEAATEEAVIGLEVSLEEFRSLGERWGIAQVLAALADLSSRLGDHQDAVAGYREAIAALEELGGTHEDSLESRAKLSFELWLTGDRQQAHELLAQTLRAARYLGIRENIATVHLAIGSLAEVDGDPATARRHLDQAGELMGEKRFARAYARTRSLR
ncbi:tetratricopeptide repeat protein [Streptomyces sp. SB3404]|uniref:Tetratricopeptide repeat protein n=1 Tax=Streptomyces boncukensis TaxID=2711219 RepID=A0A6G4X0S2_9ACTN|nr:tetratricopeptide repeat protein [Streptomyces boncukensis]